MDRTPVQSSNIAAIGYDPDVWVLEIEFCNGGLYQYAFVPPELHQGLMIAQSIGAFLYANIKPYHARRHVATGLPSSRSKVEAAESAS